MSSPTDKRGSSRLSMATTKRDSMLTDEEKQLSSKRASARMSTYSTAPTVNTVKTSFTSDSAVQEIRDIDDQLEKLDNKKLSSQRFQISEEKVENLNKLALGAKLERALGRRMGGQDAVMRIKKPKAPAGDSEKVSAS